MSNSFKRRPRCERCGEFQVKNGRRGKGGAQRWLCKSCNISSTRKRTRHSRQFEAFIQWLTGAATKDVVAMTLGVSRWTLWRMFAPHWLIVVPFKVDNTRVYDQLFMDGTYMLGGCLLLLTDNDGYVVNRHWCKRESKESYMALLEGVPAPLVATVDGHKGALSAVEQAWPGTRIQRCLLHVQRALTRQTTRNPIFPAYKALRGLGLALLKVSTPEEAAQWLKNLHDFHVTYQKMLNHRSYVGKSKKSDIPAHARKNSTWWYTHYRLRRGYLLLEHLAKKGQLFVFLDPDVVAQAVGELSRTTNKVEGLNSLVKSRVRGHRGLDAEKQRTLVDWVLLGRMANPPRPVDIARAQNWGLPVYMQSQKSPVPAVDSQDLKDIGAPTTEANTTYTDYEDGTHVRKGQMR